MEILLAHSWPGNVRELANVIERAVVLGSGTTIGAEDLTPPSAVSGFQRPSSHVSYHEAIENHRRGVIIQALAEAQGNRAAAARLLGLERSYMLKLMKSLRIN